MHHSYRACTWPGAAYPTPQMLLRADQRPYWHAEFGTSPHIRTHESHGAACAAYLPIAGNT